MDSNPKRILVVRNAALGDVLLATAVLPALTLRYPGRAIDFATSFPDVPRSHPLVHRSLRMDEFIATDYERIYDLDMSYELRPNQSILSAFAGSVGCSEAEMRLQYTVGEADRSTADQLLRNWGASDQSLVAIQSGTRFWLKNWPAASFTSLVRELEKGFSICFLQLGTADDPQVPGTIDLRGACSIGVSAALIERSNAFIGLDSALLHFSKAMGKPTAAIFGNSDPALRVQDGGRDCHIVSSVPCRFCHHRQMPPVVVPVCERQFWVLRAMDAAANVALRRHYLAHDRTAMRVARLILSLLRWREKGKRIAPCMDEITVDRALAQISPWLGSLGVPRRVPPA